MQILGVDTGGTFTDFVLYRNDTLKVHKVLSTPQFPEKAILQGIAELGLDLKQLKIIHGSTVATNAVLEGKGVKTLYIGNYGLRDVLLIGRQARRELYNLQPLPFPNPVKQEDCLETGGRVSAQGEVIEDLSEQELLALVEEVKARKPDAVAINLIFSFLNAEFEERIEAAMPDDIFVSRSSSVLPEYKEYERGMTTWLNAYVGPLVQKYLQQLSKDVSPAKVSVMQSSGGTASADQAGKMAVNMLLSGPAGGLQAAKAVGEQLELSKLITFDMGGTSTDVALIDGNIKLSNESTIIGLPVAVPMVDMHTIGAGGGSIASIDQGGILKVGPESAGASPGPASYGKGGVQATVTDANVVLGRLPSTQALAGTLALSLSAAKNALQPIAKPLECTLEQTALGIIRLANEHIAQALRVISVQKGIDPRHFTLMSFGGAGALQVCELAEIMGMSKAVVPLHSGVFSAFGMLVSPVSRELSITHMGQLDALDENEINALFHQLLEKGKKEMAHEEVDMQKVQTILSVDLRYAGQSFSLNVSWQSILQANEAFHRLHKQRYGHALNAAVELVNLRVSLKAEAESLSWCETLENKMNRPKTKVKLYDINEPVAIWEREGIPPEQVINGPALIVEKVATTFVKPGWTCKKEHHGHLILNREYCSQ